jgi:hypothetical protein
VSAQGLTYPQQCGSEALAASGLSPIRQTREDTWQVIDSYKKNHLAAKPGKPRRFTVDQGLASGLCIFPTKLSTEKVGKSERA